ncbi:MAG: Guanosine-3',5'-bis(Diphosphate) 3'-pyrophosphohydrolase [Candidatus Rifleibacterium amylolyticum]|nr:MAG: Guanosine-3',5'-bis(Diphosphate) 3'-pyrophosphohydrolase [Candidatus Rifleibacterium amylolyticum]
MATLEKAIALAAEAHAGQVDKAGQPYILHPLRVMFRLQDPQQQIAAVLHDIVEDTSVTLETLSQQGFSPTVIAAVDALTKRKGETRIDAARRAAANRIALAVKLADNAENMDLSRIASPTQKDYARIEEYRKVREILLAADKDGAGDNAVLKSIAVAVVVRDRKVLVQHRYRASAGMVFEFPCGSVDEGETFEVAAMRELREETGLTGCKSVSTVCGESRDGRRIGYVILSSDSEQSPRMVNPARKQTFYWFAFSDVPVDEFPAADQDFIRSELKKYLS